MAFNSPLRRARQCRSRHWQPGGLNDQQQGGLTYERRFGDNSIQISAYAGQRSVIQYQSIPRIVQFNKPNQPGSIIDFDRDYSGVSGS